MSIPHRLDMWCGQKVLIDVPGGPHKWIGLLMEVGEGWLLIERPDVEGKPYQIVVFTGPGCSVRRANGGD